MVRLDWMNLLQQTLARKDRMGLIARGLIVGMREAPRMRPRSGRHAAFGAAIGAIREQQGLSQERLALDAGMDRSDLGGVKRGQRNLSLTNVFRIDDALGVKPSELHAEAESRMRAR